MHLNFISSRIKIQNGNKIFSAENRLANLTFRIEYSAFTPRELIVEYIATHLHKLVLLHSVYLRRIKIR